MIDIVYNNLNDDVRPSDLNLIMRKITFSLSWSYTKLEM